MATTSLEPGPRNASTVRSGVVLVSLYSWACITVFAAVARFIIGSTHRVDYGLDDVLVLVGLVSRPIFFLERLTDTMAQIIYLGATVATHFMVNGGLGKHFSALSESEAKMFIQVSFRHYASFRTSS